MAKMPSEKPLTELKVDFVAKMSSQTKQIIPGVKETHNSGMASYESVNHSLKLIADTLGIENKEFMAL
jgi:3-polyprenyl-4-hydroxybenzoate decarboxylase